MVRGRVELRRIEERGRRQVSFGKRRKGLLKKAAELAVLCDAHVALLVFSPFDGNLHHFAAPSTVENIIERYQNFSSAQKNVDGKCLPEQLGQIETKLEDALRRAMARKTQLMRDRIDKLQEKGKSLPEERNFMDVTLLQDKASEESSSIASWNKPVIYMPTHLAVPKSLEQDKLEGDETGSKPSSGEMDGMPRLSISADSNGSVSLHHGLSDRHRR